MVALLDLIIRELLNDPATHAPKLLLATPAHGARCLNQLSIDSDHSVPLLSIGDLGGHINPLTDQCVSHCEVEGIRKLLVVYLDQVVESLGVLRSLEGLQSLVLELGLHLVNADELTLSNLVLSQELNALLTSLDGLHHEMVQIAAGSGHSAIKPLLDDAQVPQPPADAIQESPLLGAHQLREYLVLVSDLLLRLAHHVVLLPLTLHLFLYLESLTLDLLRLLLVLLQLGRELVDQSQLLHLVLLGHLQLLGVDNKLVVA